ncbi:EF-hand domain-containing protein [bacterium]|nr:EF-hand domain-containing protein [bacterium]
MNISQINNSENETNIFSLQTNLINKKPMGLNFGMKTINNSCFYAKKGEPAYMKAMDADEDDVVSFEEFKDYCKENGISTKDMAKMVQISNSYRAMQAQREAEKQSEIKEIGAEAVYAKLGEDKYDKTMDANNDGKISYKEYMEYCKDNSKVQKQKFNTQIGKSEDGKFVTKSIGKAINAYANKTADSLVENII